jgi:hypothetical protein
MTNIYKSQKTKLRDMIAIKSHPDFHDFLLCNALDKYKADRQTKGLARLRKCQRGHLISKI